MLDHKEWLHLAQELPEGGKAMHPHGCGGGNKLLVEHKEAGWAAWCYRCGEGGYKSKPRPSLSERIDKLRKEQAADNALRADPSPPLPADWEPDNWPDAPKLWLYKAGIDKDYIRSLGIYWCPRISRLVLPVLDGERLVYWQARSFDPERPKYINPKVDKPVYKAGPEAGEILCLTEDILSAARVGEVCPAWSILGTSVTPSQEAQIINFGASRVLVWLDPDQAGVRGRRKLVPYLRSLGLEARAIRADQDPKFFSKADIRRLIDEAI